MKTINFTEIGNQNPFILSANDEQGVSLHNKSGSAVVVWIRAAGQWNINPLLAPCDADGYLAADGGTDESFPMPNVKAGRLILRREPYDQAIGTSSTFEMQPEETVRLVCNDGDYNDNKGEITIKWGAENCFA